MDSSVIEVTLAATLAASPPPDEIQQTVDFTIAQRPDPQPTNTTATKPMLSHCSPRSELKQGNQHMSYWSCKWCWQRLRSQRKFPDMAQKPTMWYNIPLKVCCRPILSLDQSVVSNRPAPMAQIPDTVRHIAAMLSHQISVSAPEPVAATMPVAQAGVQSGTQPTSPSIPTACASPSPQITAADLEQAVLPLRTALGIIHNDMQVIRSAQEDLMMAVQQLATQPMQNEWELGVLRQEVEFLNHNAMLSVSRRHRIDHNTPDGDYDSRSQ